VRAVVVDEPDGRVAGYAFASIVADEGEILNLAVEPGVRRHGLGRLLLEAVLDLCRREGAATVYLEVRASNAAALHLYERAGFHSVSTRRGYYRNPTENALTMTLRLPVHDARKG